MEQANYPKPTLNSHIFRAYDIRGVVPDDLSDEVVWHLGRAFAQQVKGLNKQQVIVAADGRLSGPHLKDIFIDGLLASGCDVIDIGFVPTPVLYFATEHSPDQCGVMITGSHNPAQYNGFKMVLDGRSLSEDDIQQLRQLIERQSYPEGQGNFQVADACPDYLSRIVSDIKLQRPLKVVIDSGNGIAGRIAPTLFEQLGCCVIPLYCEVDGHFPNHHPDPSKAKNLIDLIHWVKVHQADLGIAFDGDADRMFIVSNAGQILYPDRIMRFFATDLLQRHPNAEILYDVKCSRRLPALIQAQGGTATLWKTGHSLMKRKLKETGALLAGEMSGHFFFKERWYGFDDGLYSAARFIELLAAQPLTCEECFMHFPEDISTPELTIAVSDASKFDLIEQLAMMPFERGQVSRIDGLRVDFDEGWGLVRASNTTPTLVLRFEASSFEALKKIRDDFQIRLHQIDKCLTIPQE
ncbi:phosphomannomutase/phosphoglucomutase [Nitrincola alkalisediminis]|uniref:phosphomannomutase/phosphoglucomutase n=1 Tax=Nitrincola alkalisediminis TaxID=1366656 RepID=UPI001875FC40|nr:phosphomannomutase/phosphoglucomutase [Nitrincola alkalisediminis]